MKTNKSKNNPKIPKNQKNQKKQKITIKVIHEKPLTIFLNSHEIVTLMSIGDHPNYLAIGYLLNQNMIRSEDKIKKIEYQKDLDTIIIRTNRRTNYEKKYLSCYYYYKLLNLLNLLIN